MREAPLWPANDARLIELHKLGLPWDEIARLMGLSNSTVRKRAKVLRLSNATMSAKASAVRKPPDTYQRIHGYLARGVSTLPTLPSLTMPLPEFSTGKRKSV